MVLFSGTNPLHSVQTSSVCPLISFKTCWNGTIFRGWGLKPYYYFYVLLSLLTGGDTAATLCMCLCMWAW